MHMLLIIAVSQTTEISFLVLGNPARGSRDDTQTGVDDNVT